MFIRGFDKRRKDPSNIIATSLISGQHQKLNEFLFNNQSSFADSYRFISGDTSKTATIRRLKQKEKEIPKEKTQLKVSKEDIIRKIKQRLLEQQEKSSGKVQSKQQPLYRYSNYTQKVQEYRPLTQNSNRTYKSYSTKKHKSLKLQMFNNSAISQIASLKMSLNFNNFVKPCAIHKLCLTQRPNTQEKVERSRKYSTLVSKQFARSRTWKHQSLDLNGISALNKDKQKPYLDPWSQVEEHQT